MLLVVQSVFPADQYEETMRPFNIVDLIFRVCQDSSLRDLVICPRSRDVQTEAVKIVP